MGKTSFNSPADLIKNLSDKINELNKGTLSLSDLEELVQNGHDLYEQLIILRFKAYNTLGEPNQKVEVTPEKPIEKPIEIVPELGKNELPITEEIPFDFSGFTSFEVEPEPIVETKAVEVPVRDELPTELPVSQFIPNISHAHEDEDDDESSTVANSINSIFQKEEDDSLRKKFQNAPISDIKPHITIQKKFEYISTLFGRDDVAYEDAIDFLNNAANVNEAKLKLNDLAKTYKWDLEDKSIIKFIELVERRYQ